VIAHGQQSAEAGKTVLERLDGLNQNKNPIPTFPASHDRQKSAKSDHQHAHPVTALVTPTKHWTWTDGPEN